MYAFHLAPTERPGILAGFITALGFYGGENTNAANRECCKQRFAQIPGVQFAAADHYAFPLAPGQQTRG